jgi:hypothetical protein
MTIHQSGSRGASLSLPRFLLVRVLQVSVSTWPVAGSALRWRHGWSCGPVGAVKLSHRHRRAEQLESILPLGRYEVVGSEVWSPGSDSVRRELVAWGCDAVAMIDPTRMASTCCLAKDVQAALLNRILDPSPTMRQAGAQPKSEH